MRELKFRVWDGEKFLRSSFGKKDAEFISLKIEGGILPQYGGLINYHKTMVVQQYTGMKDRNGKEIYEGDCIKNSDGLVLSVKWNQKRCCFAASRSTHDGWLNLLEALMDDFEVIGNIFENPELLK